MGLANWLTVLRILLIPVFITLLVYRQRGPALAVFLAAALTDLLDGYVISRDLILVIGALAIHMAGGRITPRPTRAGKLATFFQILTVLIGLMGPFYRWPSGLRVVIWLAATFTVISGLQYIVQGMGFLNATHADEDREPDET